MMHSPARLVRLRRDALETALLRVPQDALYSLALSQSLDRLISHKMRVRCRRFHRLKARGVRPRQLRDSLMTPLR